MLASGSPRRRELMRRLGLDFAVRAADVDETPRSGEKPEALARRLACEKAAFVATRLNRQASPLPLGAASRPLGAGEGEGVLAEIVLAADTVVSRRRRLYGTPVDAADATAMLRDLAGRGHRVITAVAVASPGRAIQSAVSVSHVWLKAWRAAEIAAYVASGDPLDKAGAYAIQNEQFEPVARLVGCRCNVVGFPLGIVAGLLERVGVRPALSSDAACPYRSNKPRWCRPADQKDALTLPSPRGRAD